MRTFILALFILLTMLGTVLWVNACIARETTAMIDIVTHLPDPNDRMCAAQASALAAKWHDIRPLVGIAINGRSINEIDRLVASLRVTASGRDALAENMTWEHYRSLLLLQLTDLQKQLGCGIWEII